MTSPDPGAEPGQAITRLPIDRLAALLRAAGGTTMDAERIRADIAAGAPVNADGTMNLIAYGAWLVHALAIREGGRGP